MTIFVRVINKLARFLEQFCSWALLLMALLTFSIVVLRYVFNINYVSLQESVIYLHAFVFLMGSATAYLSDEHVRIDFFYNQQNGNKKFLINLLGSLFLLWPVIVFVFYESVSYVSDSWRVHEISQDPGGLPFVYLLKTLILIFCLNLFLVSVAKLIREYKNLKGETK